MKLSISVRLILLVVLIVTATATTISYYLYKSGVSILADHALKNLSHNLQRDGDQLSSHLDELKRDVLLLSNSPPIAGFIRAQKNNGYDPVGRSSNKLWQQRLTSLFSTMLSTNPAYMQARLLNTQGHELIKINQNDSGIYKTSEKELQDKSTTSYFKAIKHIQAGQTYVSPINLNREFGKISQPYTPVLRCATPIFNNGKLFAVIIINLKFSHLLKEFEKTYATNEQTLYVTNHHGAYLSHPDPDKRFAFELDHQHHIQKDFPVLASLFAPGNQEQGRNITPNDPQKDILVFVKIPLDKAHPEKFVALGLMQSYMKIISQETSILKKNAVIVILLIFVSTFLAIGFANILVRPLKQIAHNLDSFTMGDTPSLPIQRSDEIGTLARALKNMADNVYSSHQELQVLNDQLEEKVETRTQEVHQNLRLMNTISQAQTAFIGETRTQPEFEIMLTGLLEVSESKYGFIGEIFYQEDDTPFLKTHALTNIAWDKESSIIYEESINNGLEFYSLKTLFGQVILTGKPVISNNPLTDERSGGIPEGHPPLDAFMGIPIYSSDKLIGMAGIANREEGYTEVLLHQLEPFITTCAHMMASIQTRQAAKQKELELQHTRDDLERAIQSSNAVFYTAKAHDDFAAIFISDNIRNQLGYEPTDFTDTPSFWADHIHPEDKQRVFDEIGKLFEHGKHTHSYRFLNKQGQYRWMQDELRLQYDEQGQPREMVGFWTDITERRQAELQLQESEQRFRRMADGAPALIWLADTENMVIWFNKSWLDYTGRALDQEKGFGWTTGIHPDEQESSVNKCHNAFNHREAFEIEFRLRQADGSYGWIVNSGIPRFTEDGEFEGYIGYCWDISDRKIFENALQESEKKFRSIINASPMGIFIYQLHDDQLIFSDYNPAANTIMKLDCSQFVGKTIEQAFPNIADTEIPGSYRCAARDGIPWYHENILYDEKQNITGAFEIHAFQTAPNTMAAMFMDVTERKKTQDDLARFKSTLDQTQDCVFMFSPETLQYFYVNQGASRLVGYTQEELLQLHVYDINAQLQNKKEFLEMVQPLLDGSQLSFTFETEYKNKDQSLIPVEVILQYISNEDQTARFVTMVRDITERKKVDRMKNEFVSTVSHELRTPLTSIRGSLGLLMGGAIGKLPDKMNNMLQIASNNTDRLLLLINDILDMQKIESGQMAFTFKPIDIMHIVEQSVRDNAAYADQYAVKLVITQRKDNIKVLGDHDRLMQVLGNLMSNAAKFSPENETIELAVAQHNNTVRVSVTDHGQGIPEEFQPKLFAQFTQSDSSDTRQKGGTGLGLSIVKAIVNKHGGNIDYITHQGIGTTMYFELPITQSKQDSHQNNIPIRQLNTHKPCLLIVEDDSDIANILQQLLSAAGYNSDIAYNVIQARELLTQNIKSYRAMTLDIQLPGTNGLSFIDELRSNPETQDLPIIVVSVEADTARHSLNGGVMGIVDWLNKPIDEKRLIQALESVHKTSSPPHILHIEDEADVHQIIKTLMANKAKLSWAKNLQEAQKLLDKEHFELILLDIALPDGLGLSLLSRIQQQHPTSKLVIYSAYDVAPEYTQQVHAVISKSNTDNNKILATIESLLTID